MSKGAVRRIVFSGHDELGRFFTGTTLVGVCARTGFTTPVVALTEVPLFHRIGRALKTFLPNACLPSRDIERYVDPRESLRDLHELANEALVFGSKIF